MIHPSEASAREKIRRAETHLADLHAVASTYRDSRPYRVLIDPPGNRGAPIGNGHRVLLWYETPPPQIGAIAGDIVTNLRSALDHVVWGLADPEKRGRHTRFPIHIHDTDEDRRSLSRAVDALDEPAVEAIEKLQPYHGPGEPRDRPLAVLAELVNEDKHRNLITARLFVPLRDFFGSYGEPMRAVEPTSPLIELLRRYLDAPTNKGGIVLVDPDRNVWEMQVEVDAPAVQVVTNTAPQRELIDTLNNVRVAVLQTLDEICVYLREYEPPRVDLPVLAGLRKPAAQRAPPVAKPNA